MTNYKERLDEVLCVLAVIGTYQDAGQTCLDGDAITRAKQAITSLIKELVEEAKPGYDMVKNSERDKAINEFEQNLLKALGNNGKAE